MLKISIGSKVINKVGNQGVIISVDKDNNFVVDFGDIKVSYAPVAFTNGFLKFTNTIEQEQVEAEIENIANRKAKEKEAQRISIEKNRVTENKNKNDKNKKYNKINKNKKSDSIRPYIDQRRRVGKPVIFMVCQNNTYDVESQNGYIWAPDHKMRHDKTDFAYHAEMDYVKKGDIIFHHFSNRIFAISIAKDDCIRKAATAGHPSSGEIGRYVELSYHFLNNPADTSGLKKEKIAYGSKKYGPFDRKGQNKQGFYLSELSDDLALAFINEAIASNPSDQDLITIKSKI